MDTAKIIEQCAAGHREAMASLYRAYSPRMLRLILRYVNDPAAAEDILHDGFIVILSHISEVRNPDRLEYWMGTIMKNLALQYLSRIEVATILEEEDEPIDTPDINDILSYEELEIIINKLPEGYRTIFKLAVFENKSHKEIGQMLGIAPHSSSSQLARAKAMLRKLIAERQAALGIGTLLIAFATMLLFTDKWPTESMPMAMTVEESIRTKTETEKESESVKAICDTLTYYAYNTSTVNSQTSHNATSAEAVAEDAGSDGERHEAFDQSITDPAHDTITDVETDAPSADSTDNDIMTDNMPDDKNISATVVDHVNDDIEPIGVKSRSSQGWSLGINCDVRSLPLANQEKYNDYTANIPNDGQNDPDNPPGNIESRPVGSQTTETHHIMPITIGVALNHQLNQRLAIETGLNLTYARSEVTERTNNVITSERVIKTYYIGIPLKLNFRIATYSPVSIYGSCGIGLDIPVFHSSHVSYGKEVYSEPWIQFSVSGGFGLEYRLSPKVSIYAEPSVRYYPGNGSSYSNFRSEHPWDVSVPVGIRFNW